MNELSTTQHGRLLSIALTVALAGGGMASLIHDPMGIALMCVCLLAGVVMSLAAIAFSIESRPAFGIMATILLPFLMFLYAVGLTVGMHHHAQWASYGFITLGALIGLNALRGVNAASSARSNETVGAH